MADATANQSFLSNGEVSSSGKSRPSRPKTREEGTAPYVTMRTLRRRLLMEKLEATKAFTRMCATITENISDVARVVSDTYRQQTELLHLQFLAAKGFNS